MKKLLTTVVHSMNLKGALSFVQNMKKGGFSLRILVAGERCNITGDYFERGSTSD